MKNRVAEILYFVDRASRYKFLLMTNLTHFFMYLFMSSLYMFRTSQCSSSGDQIVLTLNISSLALQRCLPSWDPRRTPWFFFVISQLFDAVDYSKYVFLGFLKL